MDSEPYPDPHNPPEIVTTLHGKENKVLPIVANLPYQELVDYHQWTDAEEKRFVKDSAEFSDDDIRALADIIRKSPHRYFILTHGTTRMSKNAMMLQEILKGSGKVVAFVGAMVPHSMDHKHESDGPAALDHAIERMTAEFDPRSNMNPLKDDVYMVARDSKTERLGFFDPARVEKDLEASKARLAFTVQDRRM